MSCCFHRITFYSLSFARIILLFNHISVNYCTLVVLLHRQYLRNVSGRTATVVDATIHRHGSMLVSRVARSLGRLGALTANRSTKLSAALVSTRGQSTTCSTPGVYELRTYNIAAKEFVEFLRLTSEKFALRTAHSTLVGYWTTEIGGLNQVVHIWYYASLEERARVRQALSQDDDWCGQYLSKITPALQLQDNSLLLPLPDVPVISCQLATGAYELHVLDMKAPRSEWLPALLDYAGLLGRHQRAPSERCGLLGAWRTVVGSLDRTVLLCQHASLDDAVSGDAELENRRAKLAAFTCRWNNKLLKPHSVSPLQ